MKCFNFLKTTRFEIDNQGAKNEIETNSLLGKSMIPPCHKVSCRINPCEVTKCRNHPNAKCVSNYCGGCHAFFYENGKRVFC
jgi:hypothetical protein